MNDMRDLKRLLNLCYFLANMLHRGLADSFDEIELFLGGVEELYVGLFHL